MYKKYRSIRMFLEEAGHWTTIIRKGQFAHEYSGNVSFHEDEVKKFKAVKYLPSKWNVLTRYKMYRRYAIQMKIKGSYTLEIHDLAGGEELRHQ